MSVTDEILESNQTFSREFALGHLPLPPARRLAVVACMDARLTVEPALGLQTGDAHIIRNAGGIVTDDVLRSLIISHHLLGTREVVIVNHTDCGMLTFLDADLRGRLRQETGSASVTPARFYAFADLAANVREQIQAVRSHPWLPRELRVRGFIYDVRTGRLSEVSAEELAAA
jgi:carbonic anhydrase